jgi:hypothetical protein
MQFDALEIQKIIEEKRLIFGKKIEEFFMKKLIRFFAFCGKVFAAKPTALPKKSGSLASVVADWDADDE